MDQQQDVDVVIDLGDIAGDRFDLEELIDLIEQRPGLVLKHRVRFDQQRGQKADGLLFRRRQIESHPGQIIFQEPFTGRIEERHHLPVIGRIGGNQAEIAAFTRLIQWNALQAEPNSIVFLDRERLGIDDFEIDVAPRGLGVVFQQLPHPGRVNAVLGADLGQFAREVEPHLDRFVDLIEHLAGAVRQGKQLVLGQIEPGIGHLGADQNVEEKQEHHRHGKAGDGHFLSIHIHQGLHDRPHEPRVKSTMAALT